MAVEIENINSIMMMRAYCPSCRHYQIPNMFNRCIGCKMQKGSYPTNFSRGEAVKDCSTCETLNCNSCKGWK